MSEFLQQLINGISWGSIYALIALGYTMVYGVLRLINFAHGDIYMLGAMIGYYLSGWVHGATEPSNAKALLILLVSMISCGAIGVLIEKTCYRPLRGSLRLNALITAIGVSLLLENGGQLVFGPDPKFFPQIVKVKEIIRFGDVAFNNIQLLILGVSIGLMLMLHCVVMKTRMGKAMRAVSFSHETAGLMGINVNRIISFTFFIGSTLAAAAGILVGLSNPKIEPLMGIMPGLKAFVAAVLGGIGNVVGAMLGGLIMGISETLVSGYISSTYRDAFAFFILIFILLFKPHGLLGKTGPEKL
ncbi:MAG: branched-chain amino acid ABC transporter permease [Chlamydiae bacterium]|nr:branched-chain amino acid ABC transporter permease [Chlamydiota bacterium]MBI3276826.1 branched-chain amino acid ABC transporter permease [Chlamydiota bacterium]